MTQPEFVTLQVEDGVGTIRLDRPKMNAIDEQLHREVRGAALEAAGREDVRAVVIYGGERVFAAGADIKAMSRLDRSGMVAWGRELTNSFTQVQRIPKPVIAAITGYALGGGYELALCADFRGLGTSARIGQPEILLGIIPGAGGTQRLARLVGPARAQDLVFPRRGKGLVLPGRPRGCGGGEAARPGRRRRPRRGGVHHRRGDGEEVRRRPAAGPRRGQARHRRGAGPAPSRGPGAGDQPVRR